MDKTITSRERTRESLSESRMREIRTSGLMSGSVETEYGMRLLRHEGGNPDTDLCRSLSHRATSRLYRDIRATDAAARNHFTN